MINWIKVVNLIIILTSTLFSAAQKFSHEKICSNISSYHLFNDSVYSELRIRITELNKELASPDQVMIELIQKQKLNFKLAEHFLKTMQDNGSWPDINYADTSRSGWKPKLHAERILYLTKVYLDPASPFYKHDSLSADLHKAINFWFDNRFSCPNWWHNEIGIPKTFGPVFIMLQDELSAIEFEEAVKLMEQSGFGMTGQNKVWLAGNVFYKAILTGDQILARAARDSIVSEIRISKVEGIQSDFSFHQHGPQQQFGNYGLAYITTQTYWARIFNGTTLELTYQQKSVLRNLLLQGYNWIVWNGWFDINGLGRQLFEDAQQTKGLAVAAAMMDMTTIDTENQHEYFSYFSRNYLKIMYAPFTGNKHFWRSDLTIHRSSGWYASIKMSSDRVIGTEAGNGDNLQGYYLADGATYIMVKGNEYENIFPVWNWKKIPGITTYQNDEPLKVLDWNGYRNESDFTGGISSGHLGVTATWLKRDSLSVKKTWFFSDNMMVCLGTDIQTHKNSAVSTIINQCHFNGPVMVLDTRERIVEKNKTLLAENIKWIYHDSIGYFFLQPGVIKLSIKMQQGDWHNVASLYNPRKISTEVFTLECDHGKKPENASYAYAVVPARSITEISNLSFDFEIIRNDSCCQAVKSKNGSIFMLAVHSPVKYKIDDSSRLELLNRGLYIFEKEGTKWKVTVADPTHKLLDIEFRFNNADYRIPLKSGSYSGSREVLIIN